MRVADLIVASGLKAEAFDDLRPRAVVEADLQRDRQRGRRADRAAARSRTCADGHADLGDLVRALVDEGKAVAAAAGVELCEDPWEMNVLATQRGSAHSPSMLEDVEAQRPTEVELITGALVREAEPPGVPVPLHTALYRLGQGEGGELLVRICVVGCGAVGSLFAANLAQLDDVEVWAYDAAREHVDAINRDGLRLTGRRRGRRAACAPPTDARSLPPCDFGIVATKAMHTEPAIARDRACVRGRLRARPCRTGSATRRRSPRTSSA